MALDQYERYQILARIGSGGMADVYLGVHLGEQQFRQLVVIKRISPEFIKNAAARQMFIDEALIVANLAHPHIVQIHDLREIDGGLSIAMEYVNGESLAFLLKQLRNMGKRLPIDVACKLIIEACEGLHAAHTAMGHDGEPLHLVHRDVSPHNLMINRNGYLKIIDFGIAKSRIQSDKTAPGTVKGKYSYLSPDHFQHADIDARGDQYSLGLILFEVLTGHKAVESLNLSPAQVMRVVLSRPLPKVSKLVAEISTEFDLVIARATAKDRDDRFPDVEALAAAIAAAAETHGGIATNARVRTWMGSVFKDCAERRIKLEKRLLEEAASMTTKPDIVLAPDQLPVQDHPCEDDVCGTDSPMPIPASSAPSQIVMQTQAEIKIRRFAWTGWALAVVLLVLGIGIWLGSRTRESAQVPSVADLQKNVVPQPAAMQVKSQPAIVAIAEPKAKPIVAKPVPDAATHETAVAKVAPVVEAIAQPATKAIAQPKRVVQRPKTVVKKVKPPKPAVKKPKIAAKKPPPPAVQQPKAVAAVVIPPQPATPIPKVSVVRVEPKAKPPAPEPKIPKTAYLSGNGNWSGSKVWRSGCGSCHAKPSPNKLTERKWKRFLRSTNRHAKGKFSRSELKKVTSYVISKIIKDTQTGVAGVQ